MVRLWPGTCCLGIFMLASCRLASGTGGENAGTAGNWSNPGGGFDESRYSRLSQINTGTVDRLGLAWFLDIPDEQALEATPLAINGVLYFTGRYSKIYAVDGVSGRILWTHDPEISKHNPRKMQYAFRANRGAAYAEGRIFAGTPDGRLLSLNARTGELVWSVQTVPRNSKHTVTGAPRVFDGKVVIGNSGARFGERGYVTAYDQRTGQMAWRFYTVPGTPDDNARDPVMELAAETWQSEYPKAGRGGTVRNSITYDAEFDRIYIATGNTGPSDPGPRSPGGGTNLFLASVVALDADNGRYVWHYQAPSPEAREFDTTTNMIAATLAIRGTRRKVLMHSPSNGRFYALDRETGEPISRVKASDVISANHAGTCDWQPMSFSPRTGLAYIPYVQWGGHHTTASGTCGEIPMTAPARRHGKAKRHGKPKRHAKEGPASGTGALIAWDPVARKVRWKVPYDQAWNGGTLATAGNLVFQGTADGYLAAYDAQAGKRLWRFDTGPGFVAPPMSFSSRGKQYITVLVAYGTSPEEAGGADGKGRMLTFTLDGKAKLPPSAGRNKMPSSVGDPALAIELAGGWQNGGDSAGIARRQTPN